MCHRRQSDTQRFALGAARNGLQSSPRTFVYTHHGAVNWLSRKMPPVRRTERSTNSHNTRTGDHSFRRQSSLDTNLFNSAAGGAIPPCLVCGQEVRDERHHARKVPQDRTWPSGWQWHSGHGQYYLQMIYGVYAVLGAFLIAAARKPSEHRSLISFTVWSSVVHAGIMAIQAFYDRHETGHFAGDVPAILLVAAVL